MAVVFISVVGHIGLIFHNQKVETCIQVCVKFQEIWSMFSVLNVTG